MTEREQLFAAMEKCARAGDWDYQYIVGTLYYMGTSLPGTFVQRNLDKAHLYLSNAAAHGKNLAMAKMAEVELAAGNYTAAMVWAQILGYYNPLLPAKRKVSDGYLAELIGRITEHFDSKQLPEVVKDLNAFVESYDAQIKASVAKERLINPSFYALRVATSITQQ